MLGRIQKHAQTRFNFEKETSKPKRLAAYKRFLKLEYEMMNRRHRAGKSGLQIVEHRTRVIDALLDHLFSQAVAEYEALHGPPPSFVCTVAIGGYGREELSPLSDIDILFLFPAEAGGEDLKAFQQFLTNEVLYPLWDLGLKVGHSTRTIHETLEAARADVPTKTALLNARLITGNADLFDVFLQAFRSFCQEDDPRAYLEARLRDQAERRAHYGDTVFLQEPDIKSGVGGLRDYQNTLWMARIKLNIEKVEDLCTHHYLGKTEQVDFIEAYDFLLRVRNDLHFMLKRQSDLLDLEKQPLVAHNLGYTEEDVFLRVETFMREYYQHAQIIYRTSRLLEKRLSLRPPISNHTPMTFREMIAARREDRLRRIDGFTLRGAELSFDSPNVFQEDPERLIRVFRHCQQLKCQPDFELESLIQESLPLITSKVINSPGANTSFRAILQEAGMVAPILTQMHDLGVLGRFVPEFGRLTCLVQHEYYHRYTADVHTLNTLRELDRIFMAQDPITERYRDVLHRLSRPTLLYLILFLHDIGKAFGVAGHDKKGAEMVPQILARLQVDKKYWDLVVFIIKNHLMMARIWQKHDIEDPQTIVAFGQEVEDVEQLSYLYVHTFCDARGTAGSLWNGYKNSLHTSLFRGTRQHLIHDGHLELQHAERKEMSRIEIESRKIEGIAPEEVEAHYVQLPDRYFLHTDPEEIILHIQMVNRLFENIATSDSVGALIPVIDWTDDLDRSLTVVDIVTWDRAGLFSKLAGCFAKAGLSILTAKAISRNDNIAIDTFYVVEPGRGLVQSAERKAIFESALEETLIHDRDLLSDIQQNAQKQAERIWGAEEEFLQVPIPPEVEIYHDERLDKTMVEIQANDRIGLLYEITRVIFEHGYSITFARIATERSVAIDTFYIKKAGAKGEPSEQPEFEELKTVLKTILAPTPSDPETISSPSAS